MQMYKIPLLRFSWHVFDEIKRRTVRCDERANTSKGIFMELGTFYLSIKLFFNPTFFISNHTRKNSSRSTG
jgi:hypothetical protein